LRNYAAALESTQAGLEHCAKNDLDFWQVILLGQVAQAQFEPGEWAAAEQTVGEAMALWPEPMEEVLYVQMRLAARRGAPIAPEAEQAARRFIEHSPLFDSACQFAAIMAEAAWLRGDLEQCRAEAEPLFEIARTRDNRRASGDLALWLWRVNALTKPPENAEAPYAAQIGGDWRGAAQQWAAFGCPYERGLALMDGDKEAQHQALAIFERLGAAPAAAIVRRNLRAAGVRRIPRGPRPATRKNPYHLTPRQMDILRLLAKRMTNAQIAAWLHLSTRTVEHHVAAILSKLNVNSREAAAQAAVERKLLPPI